MVGAQGSMAFYGALLPHVARPDEIDRVSTAGYAIGYVGGGVLLAANLLWIQKPALFGLPSGPGLTPDQATLPTRLAFLSVAVWWVVFSLPLLRRVPEPPASLEPGEPRGNALVAPFVRLGHTLRELRGFKQAFLLLVAFAIYNDGIQTIIKMATAYGTGIGIGQSSLIAAILVVQFVGIPFAFMFGALAGRIGAKRAVVGGLVVYLLITVLAFYMRTATHFMLLALLVGTVQGGTQALSRSLFGSMTPPHRSGEFFGFFGVFEKFSGLLGPLVYAATLHAGGSSRGAILSIALFFLVGMLLLAFVNVPEGQRMAQVLDAEATPRAA
jgi:UMF1 family MFS transporter